MIIIPKENKTGQSDVTDTFEPEALRLSELTGQEIYRFQNKKAVFGRMTETNDAIKAHGSKSVGKPLYVIGHGQRKSIQTGHGVEILARWPELSDLIKAGGYSKVVLYCPMAGNGNGCFASVLARQLGGIPVYAQTSKGHATANPSVKVFVNDKSTKLMDGPNAHRWQMLLQLDQDFRLSYPLMSEDEIVDQLDNLQVTLRRAKPMDPFEAEQGGSDAA